MIILKFILSLFYDKKLFATKYFSEQKIGYIWMIRGIIFQKLLRYNTASFPISHQIRVDNPSKIFFDWDDLQNFQHFGCYFSNSKGGKITLKKGVYIAPNVGIITTNHDKHDLHNHLEPRDVIIGENSWIGMNSVILPGVILGPNTVVGAGSIVTKSFPYGNVTLVGNPAKPLT